MCLKSFRIGSCTVLHIFEKDIIVFNPILIICCKYEISNAALYIPALAERKNRKEKQKKKRITESKTIAVTIYICILCVHLRFQINIMLEMFFFFLLIL